MPRFVILEHDMPGGERPRHWDLMFETGGALRTWSVDEPPCAGQTLQAVALPDHRLHYLDYEGPISGNRGVVRRWDQGEYETLEESAARWRLRLDGQRLQTEATLGQQADQRWCVSFEGREAVESQ